MREERKWEADGSCTQVRATLTGALEVFAARRQFANLTVEANCRPRGSLWKIKRYTTTWDSIFLRLFF